MAPKLRGNVLIQKAGTQNYTSLYSTATGDHELDVSNILNNTSTPSGFVAMFYGTSIPSGWKICNGTNGTVDMRDKFIMGTKSQHKATGGNHNTTAGWHNHVVSFTGIGNHKHAANPGSAGSTSAGTHSHVQYAEPTGFVSMNSCCCQYMDGQNWSDWDMFVGVMSGGLTQGTEVTDYQANHGHSINPGIATITAAGGHKHTLTIKSAGSSPTNLNKPPFYELVWIQKT